MKKILLAGLAALLIITTGCEKKESASTASAKKVKTIVVATSPDFSPFEFIDDNNNMTGFDVELMKLVAAQMGYELDFRQLAWDGLIPSVLAGNVDAVISGMTITPERLEVVNFSDPYYQSGVIVLVKADNGTIKSVDDLEGKKIAVQIGTTGAMRAQDVPNATVREFNMSPDTILELKNGRVDAVMNDGPVISYYLRISNDSSVKIVGDILDAESYGIAVTKNNTEMLNDINKALKELKENGSYDKLYSEWFVNN